jgi:threonine dehydratase
LVAAGVNPAALATEVRVSAVDHTISIERIEEAARVVDPVFLQTPQFVCEPLSDRLGVVTVLKVESLNPIRSFKGRGTDYLLHSLGPQPAGLVCASAGNFGQGMAYAARKREQRVTVFAALTANPMKIERMRALGADVELEGRDFDEAKEAAVRHAGKTGAVYIEDGIDPAIAEGAGTIALELCRMKEPLDALLVPLGNGALVNGIGTWVKHFSPATRVIAMCPSGAPSMELSWRAGKPVSTATMDTIADGIAVRIPVLEALEDMRNTVDEVMLVSDEEILDAMRIVFVDAGIALEPAGAAGVAAIAQLHERLAGARVAAILTGGNITAEQMRSWLLPH